MYEGKCSIAIIFSFHDEDEAEKERGDSYLILVRDCHFSILETKNQYFTLPHIVQWTQTD
jgi:hypothetical protein